MRQEREVIEKQAKLLRQKDELENKYNSSVIKQKEKAMKLNLHRFWDFRIRSNEV